MKNWRQESFKVTNAASTRLASSTALFDRFLAYYSLERSHQGYRLQGRTRAQALREALGVETLPPVVPEEEVNRPEAA